MTEEINPQNESENEEDVIVISRVWFTSLIIGVLALAIGFGVGYILGEQSATNNFDEAAAAVIAELTGGAGVAQAPQQAPQPPSRVDVSIDDDAFLGSEDAPITIVEFSDYQCPYCARFHYETFYALLEDYGDQIQFVHRDFPLSSIHPQAQKAAEASECAGDQDQYWEMHEMLFSNQNALSLENYNAFAEELGMDVQEFSDCVESGKYEDEVLADFREGQTYGVSGTPTFFVNGVRLVGAQPYAQFAALIEQELADQ